jgi:hypothetical protein
MEVSLAQREVRRVFRGGFMGQLLSGVLWLASAATATYGTTRAAILLLVVGGFFIFPATMLGLRLMGGPWRLGAANPLNGLGMQVAFVLPLTLPLVAAATVHRLEWFYPAFMIALGAHYLPFMFLYGMPMFGVLSGALVGLGVELARQTASSFAGPAWITGTLLLIFAGLGFVLEARERARETAAAGKGH